VDTKRTPKMEVRLSMIDRRYLSFGLFFFDLFPLPDEIRILTGIELVGVLNRPDLLSNSPI
jgi:hypothetical protein